MTTTLTQEVTCQVLLAVREPRVRAAAQALFTEQGWNVQHVEHAHDILFSVHQHKPQVLLLDMDQSLSDLLSLIKVLHRNPQTTNTMVLAVCPTNIDRQGLKDIATAGAAGVLLKPFSGTIVLQKIKHCLTQHQNTPTLQGQKGENSATQCPGNPSLLMRKLACPLHENPQEFWYYTLRSGKINTDMSFFDIPIYNSAMAGAVFVDYHLLAVAVCPQCFFASNNPDYFIHPNDPKHNKTPFDPATQQTLTDAAKDRLALGFKPGPNFSDEKRPYTDALIAYRAALLTSQQLYDCDNHTYAIELVRIGNYHLRIAQLMEKNQEPQDQWITEYEEAAKILKTAYVYIQGPAFYRNIYQLVAINIYLNADQEAYQYLGRLKEMEHLPDLTAQDKSTLARYLAACQKAWEDREYHRRPA